MDPESRLVDGRLVASLSDISVPIHQDQVGCFNGREVFAERVHPEVVLQDGIWNVLVLVLLLIIYIMQESDDTHLS